MSCTVRRSPLGVRINRRRRPPRAITSTSPYRAEGGIAEEARPLKVLSVEPARSFDRRRPFALSTHDFTPRAACRWYSWGASPCSAPAAAISKPQPPAAIGRRRWRRRSAPPGCSPSLPACFGVYRTPPSRQNGRRHCCRPLLASGEASAGGRRAPRRVARRARAAGAPTSPPASAPQAGRAPSLECRGGAPSAGAPLTAAGDRRRRRRHEQRRPRQRGVVAGRSRALALAAVRACQKIPGAARRSDTHCSKR